MANKEERKRGKVEKKAEKEGKYGKKLGKNLLKKVSKRRENRLTNIRKKYKMNKPCARGRIILPKIRLKKRILREKQQFSS